MPLRLCNLHDSSYPPRPSLAWGWGCHPHSPEQPSPGHPTLSGGCSTAGREIIKHESHQEGRQHTLHQGGSLIKMEEKSSLRLFSIRPHCECTLCKLVMRYQQRESVTKTTNCRPGWESGEKEIGQAHCSNYQRETSYLTAGEHLWVQKNGSWNTWEERIMLGALLKVPVKDKPHYSERIHTCEHKRMASETPVCAWRWRWSWGYSGRETDLQLLYITADKTWHAACFGFPHHDKIPA